MMKRMDKRIHSHGEVTKGLNKASKDMGSVGGKVDSNPPNHIRGDIEGGKLPHKAHIP